MRILLTAAFITIGCTNGPVAPDHDFTLKQCAGYTIINLGADKKIPDSVIKEKQDFCSKTEFPCLGIIMQDEKHEISFSCKRKGD